jgi:hypothetical protein
MRNNRSQMKNSHHQQGNDFCRDSCPLDLAPKRPDHPYERKCNNCGDYYVTCQKLGGPPDFARGPSGWESPATPWFYERLVQQTPMVLGKVT